MRYPGEHWQDYLFRVDPDNEDLYGRDEDAIYESWRDRQGEEDVMSTEEEDC